MKRIAQSFAACALLAAGCSKTDVAVSQAKVGASAIDRQLVFSGDLATVKGWFDGRGEKAEFTALDADKGIYVVQHEGNQTYAAIEKALKNRVSWIEPNYRQRAADVNDWPTDPGFLKLWGMSNIGQSAPYGTEGEPGADMGLVDAWKLSTGSRDIVVGIVDTGLDYLHPDLKDNVWVNEAEKNGNVGIDDDGNGYVDDVYGWDFVSEGRTAPSGGQLGDNDPMDDNSHGTHCAGTIGAVANNAKGVVGVTWHVRIMALKFLDSQGSGNTVDAYRAIKYGVKMKVDVLSNSWGGGPYSRLLEQAIKDADAAGVVFTAAAGNDGVNTDFAPGYPAGYDVKNVISVGASDNADTAASFSNYGASSVDVFAPGVNILSTVPHTLPVDGQIYDVYSGTSMATPHVSGLVALLLSYDSSLRHNPAAVRERLIKTSTLSDRLVGKSLSHGRVNALRALKNDTTGGINGDLVEEAYAFQGPVHPVAATDLVHTISHPGAKAIGVHFDTILVDAPVDSIYLYDANWRLVAELEEPQAVDYWAPMVPGDTVHVRFVNATVQLFNWETGEFEGSAYPNFNSEGFSIDRIRYVD